MEYGVSALNAPGSRTFIATVPIAAAIRRKRSGNKRTGQTQFSTKFPAKLSFMPQKKTLIVRKGTPKNQKYI